MKIILFFLVLLLLVIFTNNKKEFFSGKIIGDISYEDYSVNDELINKFYSDNLLEPRKMNYTLGAAGIGPQEEINTISFKPENVKSVIGDNGIKKMGGKEIANIEAIVPILFYGSKMNYDAIKDLLVDIEKVKADIIELKK